MSTESLVSVTDLIATLHAAPLRYVLAFTGGGSGVAGRLLSVPGGSRTVLEIVVPYDEAALGDYLGVRPTAFCSADTSRELARRAANARGTCAPVPTCSAWAAPRVSVPTGPSAAITAATSRPIPTVRRTPGR